MLNSENGQVPEYVIEKSIKSFNKYFCIRYYSDAIFLTCVLYFHKISLLFICMLERTKVNEEFCLNSVSTEKQKTTFSSANFQKM